MFKAGKQGLRCFALHTYKEDADEVLAEVKQARDLLGRSGRRDVADPVTEFGWATGGPPRLTHTVSEAQQAKLSSARSTSSASSASKLKIAGAQEYAWRDVPPPTDFGGGSDYWGLHTGFLAWTGPPSPR